MSAPRYINPVPPEPELPPDTAPDTANKTEVEQVQRWVDQHNRETTEYYQRAWSQWVTDYRWWVEQGKKCPTPRPIPGDKAELYFENGDPLRPRARVLTGQPACPENEVPYIAPPTPLPPDTIVGIPVKPALGAWQACPVCLGRGESFGGQCRPCKGIGVLRV